MIGDFNGWDAAGRAARPIGASSGIWETFIAGVGTGGLSQVRDPLAGDSASTRPTLTASPPSVPRARRRGSTGSMGMPGATRNGWPGEVLSLELEDEAGKWRRAPRVCGLDSRTRAQTCSKAPLQWPRRRGRSCWLKTVIPGRCQFGSRSRIVRLRHETSLIAKVSPRSVDVVERVAISVRHGTLSSLEIRVPALVADPWELVDRQEADKEELGPGPDGSRRFRLSFSRPVVDQADLTISIPHSAGPVSECRDRARDQGPQDRDQGRRRRSGQGSTGAFTRDRCPRLAPVGPACRTTFASSPLRRGLPPSLSKAISANRGAHSLSRRPAPLRSRCRRWLFRGFWPGRFADRTAGRVRPFVTGSRTHGADFPFALPRGLEWIEARIDGRIVDRVDYDESKSQYRLRFPGDSLAKPALVELDLQDAIASPTGGWQLPELRDGGIVLQALWEVRLPWSMALVGIPRGWCDENRWGWTGLSWKRSPGKQAAGQNEWLLGSTAAASSIDDFIGTGGDLQDRYLFSRRGQPTDLKAWIVPGPWLVGICSGFTLVIGFLAIFLRLRFRTVWLVCAVVAVLAAVLVEPTVTFLVFQAAALGAITRTGRALDRAVDRAIEPAPHQRAERGVAVTIRPATDSSLNRSAGVGSDDSTAIRVPRSVDARPRPGRGRRARSQARSP